MLKTKLSTVYPPNCGLFIIIPKDIHINVNKKDDINIDFLEFFAIMISDAFINKKGGVST